jgi:hypothetical protein
MVTSSSCTDSSSPYAGQILPDIRIRALLVAVLWLSLSAADGFNRKSTVDEVPATAMSETYSQKHHLHPSRSVPVDSLQNVDSRNNYSGILSNSTNLSLISHGKSVSTGIISHHQGMHHMDLPHHHLLNRDKGGSYRDGSPVVHDDREMQHDNVINTDIKHEDTALSINAMNAINITTFSYNPTVSLQYLDSIQQLKPWYSGHKPWHNKPFKNIRVSNRDILDGFPFLFSNRRTGKKAILCLVEKVGSSQWKSLLLKHLDPTCFEKIVYKDNPHIACPDLRDTSEEEFNSALKDDSIPRIMFVRDPYSRLLSAYLDLIKNHTYNTIYNYLPGSTYDKASGYGGFVEILLGQYMKSFKDAWKNINSHFLPQAHKCYLSNNKFSYDYYLKVEHTDQWFVSLVHVLGLEEEVSTGWGFNNKWHPNSDRRTCFYHPSDRTCEEMEQVFNASITTNGDRSHIISISDDAPEGYRRNNYQLSNIYSDSGGHNKGAGTIAILDQYYNRDIAFNVSLLVQADLELFHYPSWTGRNASKHVSSLRFDKS